tara:strand:+ start:17905 stop:18135 length:231 start_codon:yes stop_codon:yes gene_type:complete
MPSFGDVLGTTPKKPDLLFVVPQSLVDGLRRVEAWQWFAGMVVLVVSVLALSNFRNVRRRKALDSFEREEPGLDDW